MGKSMSGPDETDVISMMAALSALHSGRVELTVSLDGSGFVPFAVTRATMYFDVLPGSSLPPKVEVEGKWPCNAHQTWFACVYDGLHRLDYAISRVYSQEELWNNKA